MGSPLPPRFRSASGGYLVPLGLNRLDHVGSHRGAIDPGDSVLEVNLDVVDTVDRLQRVLDGALAMVAGHALDLEFSHSVSSRLLPHLGWGWLLAPRIARWVRVHQGQYAPSIPTGGGVLSCR